MSDYVLVPMEPTEEMLRAGVALPAPKITGPDFERQLCDALYRAMISAAPSATPSAEQKAGKNAERKDANAAPGINSTMTPRIVRVGENDAHRSDGLSVTEIVGTVAKAIVAEAFVLTQPSHGNVFGWIDDHAEQLASAALAALPAPPNAPLLHGLHNPPGNRAGAGVGIGEVCHMMERPLSVEDIERSWGRFGGNWDFRRMPVLRFPVIREIIPYPSEVTGIAPASIPCVEVRIEHGWWNGEESYRLIGRIPGTDLEKVLEIKSARSLYQR